MTDKDCETDTKEIKDGKNEQKNHKHNPDRGDDGSHGGLRFWGH